MSKINKEVLADIEDIRGRAQKRLDTSTGNDMMPQFILVNRTAQLVSFFHSYEDALHFYPDLIERRDLFLYKVFA